EVAAFDEFHHQKVRHALGGDRVNGHDIRMAERDAHLPFSAEMFGLLGTVAVSFAQHLDGADDPRVLVDGAVHAGEAAARDHVQDFVVAVEIAGPLPLEQAIELEVGQQLAAQQQLDEIFHRDIASTELSPDFLELAVIQQVLVERALSNLFSGQLGHCTLSPGPQARPREAGDPNPSSYASPAIAATIRWKMVAVAFNSGPVGGGSRRVRAAWLPSRTAGTSCRDGAG